mmetsp:Transcript_13066/g.19939  ORF Transcript_13066/g.19939 Transcript_13066/m.19939 type:complete len:671 (+) Transcript_13066:53-2065(+)
MGYDRNSEPKTKKINKKFLYASIGAIALIVIIVAVVVVITLRGDSPKASSTASAATPNGNPSTATPNGNPSTPTFIGKATRVTEYPPDGIELGQGWDGTRGHQKSSIGIIFEEKSAGLGQSKTEDYIKVTDKSRLMQEMDISAEFQYSGINARGSAKFSFASKIDISSTSQCFIARAKVQNGRIYTAPHSNDKQVKLSPEAVELAKQDKDEFYRVYGDSFVSAIHSGAELYASMTFDEQEKSKVQELEASVEGSGWGFSAESTFRNKMESYSKQSKLKINYYQAGGSGDPLPTDVAGFLSKMNELPELAKNAPHRYSMTLQRYDTLPNWPAGTLESRPSGYLETIQRYFEYQSIFTEINNVESNPDDFLLGRGTDLDELENTKEAVRAELETIENNIADFELGEIDSLPEPSIPDYDFRVKMPLPLRYDPTIKWEDDAENIRDAIKEFWVEKTSDSRCLARGFSHASCLDSDQIEQYVQQITVNHVVVVGGRQQVNALNSGSRWLTKIEWGTKTNRLVEVTTFRTWSSNYGESQGKLEFYIGVADKPGLIRGWRQFATSMNSSAKFIMQREWGHFDNLEEVTAADFRCWSPQYNEGHCHLKFFIEPTASDTSLIQGWRYEASTKNSSSQWILQSSWGESTGEEIPVASFRTFSPQYKDGHGKLLFALSSP